MDQARAMELKKSRVKILLFGGASFIFFASSALLITTYAVPGDFAGAIRSQMPLPAVVVDRNQWITFREVASDMKSIRQFYESQNFSEVGLRVDFSGADGKKRLKVREKELLNKMIEDRAIESLARNRGVVISDEMVDQSVKRKLDEFGSAGTVEEDLGRLYGWTLSDFKNKIVRSASYEDALKAIFEKDTSGVDAAKLKVGEVETALARGSPFDAVAKEYSDGRTASSGGMLGWFTLENLIPELRKNVETGQKGVVQPVVESPLGFHVLRVEDVKEENGVKHYELSQIFVKKPVFSDWLSDQMKQMRIWAFESDYDWNRETARLEFRDQAMRNFEADLMSHNTGDAAFLFY